MLKDLISSNGKKRASDESDNFDLDKFLGPKPSISESKTKRKDTNEIKNSMDISQEAEAEAGLKTDKMKSILANIEDDFTPIGRVFMKHKRDFKHQLETMNKIQANPELRKPDEFKKKFLQEPLKDFNLEKRVKKEFAIETGEKEKTTAVFDAMFKKDESHKIKKITEIPSYHHSPVSKSKLNPFESDIKAKQQQKKIEKKDLSEKTKTNSNEKSSCSLSSQPKNNRLNKSDVMTLQEKLKVNKFGIEETKEKLKEPIDVNKIRGEIENQVRKELEMKYKAEIEGLKAMVANNKPEEKASNVETNHSIKNKVLESQAGNRSYNPLSCLQQRKEGSALYLQEKIKQLSSVNNNVSELPRPYNPLERLSSLQDTIDSNFERLLGNSNKMSEDELTNLLKGQDSEENQGSLHSPSLENSDDSGFLLTENAQECKQYTEESEIGNDEELAQMLNNDLNEIRD